MSETKILVVAKDSEAGNAYLGALSEIGVACDVAGSIGQMAAMATERPYNGLLVDLLTLIRSTPQEKVIAYEFINLFPVLRVKWEPRHKKIKLSPLEQSFSPDAEAALRFFVEQRCKAFPARAVRKNARREINLNLLYSSDAAFPETNTHRTFTINIGPDGLFMHTMHEFETGATIWLRFVEFSDQAPIAVSVRWSRQWGVTRCIPGVGVRFESLTEEQEREIRRIIGP